MSKVSFCLFNSSNDQHVVWALQCRLEYHEDCVYIGSLSDAYIYQLQHINFVGRPFWVVYSPFHEYRDGVTCLKLNTTPINTFKGLVLNGYKCRQVYIAEAEAAAVAFLIMTTVRKEVAIHKDVARHIAKLIYDSHKDTIWENAAPFIVPVKK